jgi:hypothetical protein
LVQVFGVDDAVEDNNVNFFVNFGTALSGDLGYDGLTPAPLSFQNVDDDSSGITVSAGSFMLLSEIGTSSTFEVVLNSQPSANVTISVSSSDTTEGTVSTGTLAFTTGNWFTPQSVQVTGADDAVQDGNVPFTVDLSAASSDTVYDGLPLPSLAFETIDNDSAGVSLDIGDGLVTTESGATDSFQLVLNSEPTASVDINLTSTNPSEVTINPIGVSFDPGNWFHRGQF